MKLTLRLRDDGWYVIKDDVFPGAICSRGLAAYNLLPYQALMVGHHLPAEIHLSFFLKNPKKAEFQKINFVRGDFGYNVEGFPLTNTVRSWIATHIPGTLGTNHFSIWMKSDYSPFK